MFFRMVNDEKIIAEGGRYLHILPQFIPWLMVKLKAPLYLIMITFSCMYLLILYLVFWLIGKGFGQKNIAYVFLFLLLISVNETFFDIITETKYSLALACLFLAYLESEQKQHYWIGIIILFCGFYTHPIFAVYCFIILIFKGFFMPSKMVLHFALIGFIIMLCKAYFSGPTAYEKDLVSAMFEHPSQLFKNSFIHTYFDGLLKTQFIILFGLSILIFGMLIKLKKWPLLVVYLATVFSLYFILAIVYSKGDSHMMIQKTLFVFHFLLLLPFLLIESFLPKRVNYCFNLLLMIGSIWALIGITNTAKKYTERTQALTQFMRSLPSSSDKFLINESQINHEVIMGTWALPHESILISKIKLQRLINLKNFRERNDTLFFSKYPTAIRPAFGYPLTNCELNNHYFKNKATEKVRWLDSTYTLGKR